MNIVGFMIPSFIFAIIALVALIPKNQRNHIATLENARARRNTIPGAISNARSRLNSFSDRVNKRQRGMLVPVPPLYTPVSNKYYIVHQADM